MADNKEIYLSAKGLTKVFGAGSQKTIAVDHVDINLHKGEVVSIVGESGSGKTTLSKMLLGLISLTEGEIYFQGHLRDIRTQKKKQEYWKNIQAIFQDPYSSYNIFNKIDSVLMLIQTFLPAIGGAEKQALELSRSLISRGIRVTVVTRRIRDTAAEENMDGVRVVRLAAAGSGALNSAVFMLKSFFWLLANRASYDAVHVHLASSPAVAAVLAGRLTGRRTLVKMGGGKGVDEISLSQKTLPGRLKLAFFRFARPELLVMNSEVYDWLKGAPEFSGLRLRRFRSAREGV